MLSQDEHKRVVWFGAVNLGGENHGSLNHGTMVDTLIAYKMKT